MDNFKNSKRADAQNASLEGDILSVGLLENDPIEEIFFANI